MWLSAQYQMKIDIDIILTLYNANRLFCRPYRTVKEAVRKRAKSSGSPTVTGIFQHRFLNSSIPRSPFPDNLVESLRQRPHANSRMLGIALVSVPARFWFAGIATPLLPTLAGHGHSDQWLGCPGMRVWLNVSARHVPPFYAGATLSPQLRWNSIVVFWMI